MSTKISAPWVECARKIEALFGQDPEIHVNYEDTDENGCVVKLYVENAIKADALSKILPAEKIFGNVALKIQIIPANEEQSEAMIFRNALNGNPAFCYALEVTPAQGGTFTYIGFEKEVVQYFNDNLADPHGLVSTLWQDVARDLFDVGPGVFFCTDNVGPIIESFEAE